MIRREEVGPQRGSPARLKFRNYRVIYAAKVETRRRVIVSSSRSARTVRRRAHDNGASKDGSSLKRKLRSDPTPSDDLVQAFVARTGRALARIAERMPRERLVAVVGAETDTDVLFGSLQEAAAIGAEIVPDQPDPLTAAYLRGAEMKRELLRSEGGMLSGPQLAEHLGITPQAIGKKRDKNHVFWLELGEGYSYPAFQVGASGLLPDIREVLDALAEGDPWARVSFMLTGDARLGGRRPLDVLREGDVASVARAARGYGEHGA